MLDELELAFNDVKKRIEAAAKDWSNAKTNSARKKTKGRQAAKSRKPTTPKSKVQTQKLNNTPGQ